MIRLGEILRLVLRGTDGGTLEGRAEAIGLAAYTSGLGPMLGWWIEQGMLAAPQPLTEEILGVHLDQNRQRMQHLLGQATAVAERLRTAGIDVLVLKGAHTAVEYFPEPGCRPMSDVDLLVAAKDASAAAEILRAAGFNGKTQGKRESSWHKAGSASEPKTLLFVDAGDPWSIDLHHSLTIDIAPCRQPARLDAAEPMRSAGPWPCAPAAGCLSQPLLLLHLCVHAGAGFHNITLLRLLELVLVIRRDTARGLLCWEEFLDLARRTGSLGFAYPALALCRQLAPVTVPDPVIEACRQGVPPRVVRVVEALTPATAQRVHGASIREHFMWAQGLGGWSRQLAADLLPAAGSAKDVLAIYRTRGWRLLRAQVSR